MDILLPSSYNQIYQTLDNSLPPIKEILTQMLQSIDPQKTLDLICEFYEYLKTDKIKDFSHLK